MVGALFDAYLGGATPHESARSPPYISGIHRAPTPSERVSRPVLIKDPLMTRDYLAAGS